MAVIDDGVDFSHPDLAERAWTNPGESGGGKETNGIDDDGNGYIDDVHGWDFCHDDNTVHDVDDDWHGTHVAGTIAASLDGQGVVGVAPGVSIMALKFLGDDDACGYDSMAIGAIAYAKSFGVQIANASWGAEGRPTGFAGPVPRDPDLGDAVRGRGRQRAAPTTTTARRRPCRRRSTCRTSCRSGPSTTPAGSTWFSNYGRRTVDLVAPGESILSSLPADADHPEPGWGWLDGTSMAAPHVTGTAALVASYVPGMAGDPIALKARILGSAKPDAATAGSTVTGRIVDVYRALDRVPPSAKAPTVGFLVGSTMSASTAAVSVHWAATDDRSGVGAYGLQARSGSGAWTTVLASTGGRSANRSLRLSQGHGFRVRARDGAGNWGAWSPAATVTPVRYQETTLPGDLARDVASIRHELVVRRVQPLRHRQGCVGHVPVHRAGLRDRLAEGTEPGQRPPVRRRRLYLDHRPPPIELDAADHRRGTIMVVVGNAQRPPRLARDARALPDRRRRVPGPALTLSCRGRSSPNTAPAAAARGSSARCP